MKDINSAIVYSVNQPILDEHGLEMARRVNADVLIRCWFKWGEAKDYAALAPLAARVHEAGQIFGGGVTCSALIPGENGLSDAELADMATRGSRGEFVDAWKGPGWRHGTLSNPKYVDYILSWCYRQIDSGVDCLFMDERAAALHLNEGFDDYSIVEFRWQLLENYCDKQSWKIDDARWTEQFQIDFKMDSVTPDGTMKTFDYRGFLAQNDPPLIHTDKNPLTLPWALWRNQRDDRAWKCMVDSIHHYAARLGRRVYINGNGLDPHVDLQVLGVWEHWLLRDGKVDFSRKQLREWAQVVRSGHQIAGGKVPVVFFHDWGDGFMWSNVTPEERTLWNRIRGAEIYAAGAFYAFPVSGRFGSDAMADGTLDEIVRQAAFYRQNKSLYLDAQMRSISAASTSDPLLSVSLWSREQPASMMVHVINRNVVNLELVTKTDVMVKLPTDAMPRSVRLVSPDWEEDRSAIAKRIDGSVRVVIPELHAYVVIVLDFADAPVLKLPDEPMSPTDRWGNPLSA